MSKTLNILNRVIGMVNKSQFVNQLYYSTDGGELEIYQNDPAAYAEGDRTNLEKGVVTLSDGASVTVEDFVITKIDKAATLEEIPVAEGFNEGATPEKVVSEEVPAIPAEIPVAEEVVAPVSEPAIAAEPIAPVIEPLPGKVIEKTESTITTKEVVATQISSINTWEFEVINTTFEVGEKVEYKPSEEGELPSKVTSGEYLLEDGRKVLVDSDGVIQMVKPGPAQAPAAVEAEGPSTDVEEVKAKYAALEEKNGKLEETISKLKMQMEEKFEAMSKFEAVATEAIDTIASNLGSNFKASVKGVKSTSGPKGSIFSQLKEKRGL